jgi:hypothetical protein
MGTSSTNTWILNAANPGTKNISTGDGMLHVSYQESADQ